MLEDFLFKSVRKSLSSGLYKKISKSFLGRDVDYHKPETYLGIYRHYCAQRLIFRDQIVIEVGPGNQLFTAFFFLSEGARTVIVVDPLVNSLSAEQQLKQFNAFSATPLGEDAVSKIRFFNDISMVPVEFNSNVGVICSFTVLEHLPDLPSFYAESYRLLSDSGLSYHFVDLSDHTYHVFGKSKLTQRFGGKRLLYHWRYSGETFEMLNDPKCYMNRKLLPVHLKLATQQGFKITELNRTPYKTVPIHSDLLSEIGDCDPQDLFITSFSFKLLK